MLGAGSFVPMTVTRIPNRLGLPSSGAYPMDVSGAGDHAGRGHPRQFHLLVGVNPWPTTLSSPRYCKWQSGLAVTIL